MSEHVTWNCEHDFIARFGIHVAEENINMQDVKQHHALPTRQLVR